MALCPSGNLNSLTVNPYSGMSGLIHSKSRLTRSRSLMTYRKTLVTGKAIAEFAYCGLTYKDTLSSLERKFGQPHAVVSVHLDNLSNFPPPKMHNSDNIINYSASISSLVPVLSDLI